MKKEITKTIEKRDKVIKKIRINEVEASCS